jgi:hypothetical protein
MPAIPAKRLKNIRHAADNKKGRLQRNQPLVSCQPADKRSITPQQQGQAEPKQMIYSRGLF